MLFSGIVSVVSIAIYGLLAPFSVAFIGRKFFSTAVPWLVLLVFFILRILGNAFTLATQTSYNQHLLMGSAICNAVGLGPLFIATTRLLTQCNGCVRTKTTPNQVHRALVTFELCTVVSTVLTIVGGVQSFKPTSDNATVSLKVGVCLYAATYACILCAAVVIASRLRKYKSTHGSKNRSRSVVVGLYLASILLLVRLIYSLLAVFQANPRFSLFNGDESVQLGMQIVEEWIVSLVYLCLGWLMRNERPAKVHMETSARGVLRYVPFVHWFVT